MKSRLTTLDLISSLDDLVPVLVGMRVNQIYDIDKKTLLIRLQRPEEGKKMLLIESGTRLHTTGKKGQRREFIDEAGWRVERGKRIMCKRKGEIGKSEK